MHVLGCIAIGALTCSIAREWVAVLDAGEVGRGRADWLTWASS
jgi:hypothetical protein